VIFDVANKQVLQKEDTSELVLEWRDLHNTLDPSMRSSEVPYQTKFLFTGDRLEVWADCREITGNLKNLEYIFNTETPTGHSKSISTFIPTYEQEKHDLSKRVKETLDHFAKLNGIDISRLPGDFEDRFLLYCYPLLRTVYDLDVNFHNIKKWPGTYEDDPDFNRLPSYFKKSTLKEAIKEATGVSSSKMLKLMGGSLIRSREHYVEEAIMKVEGGFAASMLERDGFVPSITATKIDSYHVFIRKEIRDKIFDTARFLIKLLSVDHFYRLVEHNSDLLLQTYSTNPDGIIDFFRKHYTDKRIYNLFMQSFSKSYLRDLINQYNEYKDPDLIPPKLRGKYHKGIVVPKKVKSIQELHDKISAQYNEIKAADKNKTIPYTAQEFELHGHRYKDVELILPSEGSVLVEWGKTLSHCIASYAERASKKEILLVGVKVCGKLLYTLEIKVYRATNAKKALHDNLIVDNNGNIPLARLGAKENLLVIWDNVEIKQFYGYKNKTPEQYEDKELRGIVTTLLEEVLIRPAQNEEDHQNSDPENHDPHPNQPPREA